MIKDLKSLLEDITAGVAARAAEAPLEPAVAVAVDPRREAIERQIPTAFRWATVASPELRAVLGDQHVGNLVARILAAPRAVLIGPAGAGKTALACAALRSHLEQGGRARFAPSFRLATARARSRLGEEAADVALALTTPRLFIDELGGELLSPTSALAEIIYERHLEGRFTAVTTPFEPAEIAVRYGDGIARKVFQGATVIRLGAPRSAAVGAPAAPERSGRDR